MIIFFSLYLQGHLWSQRVQQLQRNQMGPKENYKIKKKEMNQTINRLLAMRFDEI